MDLEAGKSEILKEVGEGMCTHDHMRLQNEISRGLLLFLEDFLPVCWFLDSYICSSVLQKSAGLS